MSRRTSRRAAGLMSSPRRPASQRAVARVVVVTRLLSEVGADRPQHQRREHPAVPDLVCVERDREPHAKDDGPRRPDHDEHDADARERHRRSDPRRAVGPPERGDHRRERDLGGDQRERRQQVQRKDPVVELHARGTLLHAQAASGRSAGEARRPFRPRPFKPILTCGRGAEGLARLDSSEEVAGSIPADRLWQPPTLADGRSRSFTHGNGRPGALTVLQGTTVCAAFFRGEERAR